MPLFLLILICFILLLAFVLYCCFMARTPYDREIDDEEQMKFLREHRRSSEKN